MRFYPENKAGHYFTKLPQPINLEGEYEVGLSEIQFSNTYFNVNDGECWYRYRVAASENQPSRTLLVHVPAGLYETNEYFISCLNKRSTQMLGKLDNGKPRVKFYYNRASKQMSFSMFERRSILQMSPKLQRILSLPTDIASAPGRYEGIVMMDLNEDVGSVFVYCDLVHPRQIGDAMGPLLRIVPTENKTSDFVHRIFEKPHYIALDRTNFTSVELYLTNHLGKQFTFASGNTVITLHFRRRRPEHF